MRQGPFTGLKKSGTSSISVDAKGVLSTTRASMAASASAAGGV